MENRPRGSLVIWRELNRQGGRLLLFCSGLGDTWQAETSGAVFAFIFDVEFFRHGRNQRGASGQLPKLFKDDLGAAVVFLQVPVNFDHAIFELAHVADIF